MILFLLMILARMILAAEYDPLLLRAQASIFPKIVMLDKQIEDKTINNEVVLSIVSTKEDIPFAELFRRLIEEKYKHNIGDRKLTVLVNDFESNDYESAATTYILLEGSASLLEKVVSHAANNKRIVFSYNYDDFRNKALISLFVKEKTYVYLNRAELHNYDIKFTPVFYKIVKIIE